MFRRWYDNEPTLSLAISLLKNAAFKERNECANYVVQYCKDNGYKLSNDFFDKIQYTLKRWYDKEKQVYDAIEYIKCTSYEMRKNIATNIIEYLQKANIKS